MEKLNYTTTEINRNFKIKVSGQYDGQKVNTLVGVSGLVKYVADVELVNRLLDRAFASMMTVLFVNCAVGYVLVFTIIE